MRKLVAMAGGPPGAVAVVQAGRGVQVITAGVGNTTTRRAIGGQDTARIASVAKAFNGAIALALVTDKKLSLGDTIGKVLPDLPSAWSAVTLSELLQHTSGVPDYIKSDDFLTTFKSDPHAVKTPQQLLSFVSSKNLDFPPGSKYGYSDSDNIIVGLMVEAVTHESYEAALEQYVTKPLTLNRTTLPVNADLPQPYIHGYDVEAGKAPEDVSMLLNPGLAWASGGMLSTPQQLNTFMRAYAGGKLFDAATRHQQLQFVPGNSGPPGPGTNSAGLAIFRYATSCGTIYGHTGNFPGYTIFAASNLGGSRSVDVIVNEQLNDNPATKVFTALRHVDLLGVCAALRP